MSVQISSARVLGLEPCKHQVAGHMFEEGKAGSLVDNEGHFYKPLQVGPRGEREKRFYQYIHERLQQEAGGNRHQSPMDTTSEAEKAWHQQSAMLHSRDGLPSTAEEPSVSGRRSSNDELKHRTSLEYEARYSSWSSRNAVMLQAIPRYYGLIEVDGRQLVELEDVTRRYKHPSIADIKVGLRTWYSGAEQSYIERCKLKDAATTQAALGYKVCGMQVYRHCQGGYWKASKRWCKKLPQDAVNKALIRFASNEAGLCPACVYGGPDGAIEQLKRLEKWFQEQREFLFYSSSVLLIYEGDAETMEEANVSIRLVDFAHTFSSEGKKDTNFIAGLRAVIKALTAVMTCKGTDDFTF